MAAIAAGETDVKDVLAAVTPGGGKSLLPVISAARLFRAGTVDRICWIVPRDTLRLQAEEAFSDPAWRTSLGHQIAIRPAENRTDPSRGLGGYVTTYQAIAAAPDLHLTEFQRHRYLLAVDELHHLPALNDLDAFSALADETTWSQAIRPLLESATVRLLMSGTLARADGRAILWLPYKNQSATLKTAKYRQIDIHAQSWAVVGYSRRQALAERAVIPVTFGAMDGTAMWRPRKTGVAPNPSEPVALSAEPDLARYALYTALRTEFADEMLRRAFEDCRAHRQRRRLALALGPGDSARGLGKMLVVASDQVIARRYAALIGSWLPQASRHQSVRIATSDVSDAQEAIAAFRLRPDPVVLVTVAMAYEGMDAPEVTHVAALTHIRSRPWLEQMVARATRVDSHGGPWEHQRATIYHPDDMMFRRFRQMIETDQGMRAKFMRGHQGDLLDPKTEEDGEDRDWGLGIEPLTSNATTLRFDRVRPGPEFVSPPIEDTADRTVDGEPPERALDIERRLRQRIGQMVAGQVVEDEDKREAEDHPIGYHTYNAVLKRVHGGRGRADLTRAELEAAIGWLERNRLADHIHLIENDPRYAWSARRQRIARQKPGDWAIMLERHYTKNRAKTAPSGN